MFDIIAGNRQNYRWNHIPRGGRVMETEFIFFWFTAIFYGVSTFFYILSFISKKEKFIRWGTVLVWLGFLAQTLSSVWFWAKIGADVSTLHTFTVMTRVIGTAWMGVLVFLLAQLFAKPVRPAGVLVMPITILLLIWAATSTKEVGTIPVMIATWWFWVHISSGGLAFGFVLTAGAVALLYLLEETTSSEKLSELKELDNLNYRFVALGFLMLTIMIISGSLWANQAHGRYWGWDPIEIQSLVSWLIYAIWLHLRLTFGWRGRKLAWYSLFALVVIGINLTGVPFMEKAFHSGFRIQH